MSSRCQPSRISHASVPLIFFFLPSVALGAAPVYFDIGGLILGGLLYIAGFLVLVFMAILSRPGPRKNVSVFLLLPYLAIPPLMWGIEEATLKNNNKKAEERLELNQAANRKAFGEFCADSFYVVHRKILRTGTDTIEVKFGKATKASWTDYGAHAIAKRLKSPDMQCEQHGVRYLIGKYPNYGQPDKTFKYERFDICSSSEREEVEEVSTRYSLVVGESVFAHPVPAGYPDLMSGNSVQIKDSLTGEVLAEDVLYVAPYGIENSRCKSGLETIVRLIDGTFSETRTQ